MHAHTMIDLLKNKQSCQQKLLGRVPKQISINAAAHSGVSSPGGSSTHTTQSFIESSVVF